MRVNPALMFEPLLIAFEGPTQHTGRTHLSNEADSISHCADGLTG